MELLKNLQLRLACPVCGLALWVRLGGEGLSHPREQTGPDGQPVRLITRFCPVCGKSRDFPLPPELAPGEPSSATRPQSQPRQDSQVTPHYQLLALGAPEEHYRRGRDLARLGKIEEARKEFEIAGNLFRQLEQPRELEECRRQLALLLQTR